MKSIIKYLLFLLLTCTVSVSYSQFWKRKGHHTKTASNGISKKKKNDAAKDAFRRKSRKGANQKTTGKPFWRSKKNLHKHATTRKGKQGASKDFHKKRMLKRSALKPPSGSSKGERKGRKSSGNDKGTSRGRKK